MKRFCADMKKYWRYVVYAGQSELRAEVANSYLNWLWWIIEPLCFMLIYSFVFGFLFGSKIEHIQIFVYIGITMWDFFNRMLNASVKLVRHNKSIVSKVYIPKYMLILVKMYVNAFKLMIAFILLFIMLLVGGVTFNLHMLWIFPVILAEFIVTFGICTFLLHFGVYVDDLANVVHIFLRMLFYLTGVFYDLETRLTSTLGERAALIISHCNPMASFLIAARNSLLYATTPDLRFLFMWIGIGLVLSVLGVRLIYKNENTYVKVI